MPREDPTDGEPTAMPPPLQFKTGLVDGKPVIQVITTMLVDSEFMRDLAANLAQAADAADNAIVVVGSRPGLIIKPG